MVVNVIRKLKLLSCVPRVEVNRAIFAHSVRAHSDAGAAAVAEASSRPVAEAGPRAPLMDTHGRLHNYLRISLTERCNLRCQYCMPAGGAALSPGPALLSRGELARAVRVLAALGVSKIRLTGGEPTLRRDLEDIIQELSSVAGIASVSMTTNGVVLTRRLPALQRAGLAALNVSLDSLRPERYERMARRPGLSRVLAGIDLALQLGYRPLKVNTVLMKDFNDDEIGDFVEFTRDREVEVRFIEFMPFSGNSWETSRLVPYRTALRRVLHSHPGLRPLAPRPHDTARVWKVPGYAGSVGFIASMTQNFCSTCNRLRLTADGNLKVCLFGSAEVSVRDALRGGCDDAGLEALVRAALVRKLPRHAGGYDRAGAYGQPTHGADRWITGAWGRAGGTGRAGARAYSDFSHLDEGGRARIVDVGDKAVTARRAEAACRVRVGAALLGRLRAGAGAGRKGDALPAARLAGLAATKRTADLIPLCHPLALDAAQVHIRLPEPAEEEEGGGGWVEIRCEVRATARTGAEMEALTGCAVAALTLYDMCKALERGLRVSDLRLVRKSGGRSGDWPPPDSDPHTSR